MNPRVKKKWVKALRSGEYRQTRRALKRSERAHCCLGVLCDLAPRSVGRWEKHTFVAGASRTDMPPGAVLEWADLEPSQAMVLANLNDRDGRTFAEIADHIEATL